MKLKYATLALLLGMTTFSLSSTSNTGAMPAMNITGKLFSWGTNVNQKNQVTNRTQISTKGNVTFNVTGLATNGIEYGFIAVLELDRAKTLKGEYQIDEAYFFMSSDWGNIQLGDTDSAQYLLMYDGGNVMGAMGGFNREMWRVVNMAAGMDKTNDSWMHFDHSSKITYTTPEFYNLQLGVSYSPDSAAVGNMNKTPINTKKSYHVRDFWTAGATYGNTFGDFELSVYLNAAFGDVRSPSGTNEKMQSLRTYQVGTLMSYGNWQFGAGGFHNGKSGAQKVGNTLALPKKTGKGYNIATSYGFGPITFAVGHAHSRNKVEGGNARKSVSSITANYYPAKGLVLFAEFDAFRLKTTEQQTAAAEQFNATLAGANGQYNPLNTGGNNRGSAFIFGTQVYI